MLWHGLRLHSDDAVVIGQGIVSTADHEMENLTPLPFEPYEADQLLERDPTPRCMPRHRALVRFSSATQLGELGISMRPSLL
jgi:hypothetical protein